MLLDILFYLVLWCVAMFGDMSDFAYWLYLNTDYKVFDYGKGWVRIVGLSYDKTFWF